MLPQAIFDKYKEFGDSMISELGVDCLLYYPSIKTVTTTDIPTFANSKSMRPNNAPNIHNGQNIVETEQTEIIRLRTYWTKKDFDKIAQMDVPAGGCMTIGHLRDLTKIHKCIKLRINVANQGSVIGDFVRVTDPIPWGLRKEHYFVCTWNRV